MKSSPKIPHRNQSPNGWWIYQEVEQWVSLRQKSLSPKSYTLVHENTRILKAKNRDDAYEKAIKIGKKTNPSVTNGGEWRFVGISMLLPMYEELEDGAELLWTDRGRMRQDKVHALVKAREELPVFDDSPTTK